jgi:hypothetical protein
VCPLLTVRRSVADLVPLSHQFVYSSTHVIGIGLRGVPPPHLKTMCWYAATPEEKTGAQV